MFKSKTNPFLAQMLNLKKLDEITYVLNAPDGTKVVITNIELLNHFLEHAKLNQSKTIQNMLAKSNYSAKEINSFAKHYAKVYLLNLKKKKKGIH